VSLDEAPTNLASDLSSPCVRALCFNQYRVSFPFVSYRTMSASFNFARWVLTVDTLRPVSVAKRLGGKGPWLSSKTIS
jgi:hypothetical protein